MNATVRASGVSENHPPIRSSGPTDARDAPVGRIDAEEVPGGPLRAPRSRCPSVVHASSVRVLVERVGERPRRPAGGRHHGDERVARGRSRAGPLPIERDAAPSGDQRGFAVGPGLRHDLRDAVVGEIEHVDVRGAALDRSGFSVALNAMRLPSGDQASCPGWNSAPFVRCRARHRRREASATSTSRRGRSVVAPHDLEVAQVVLAVLVDLALGFGRGEGDASPSGDHAKSFTPVSALVTGSPRHRRAGSRTPGSCRPRGAGERQPSPSGDHRACPADFCPRVNWTGSPSRGRASHICVTKASCAKSALVHGVGDPRAIGRDLGAPASTASKSSMDGTRAVACAAAPPARPS